MTPNTTWKHIHLSGRRNTVSRETVSSYGDPCRDARKENWYANIFSILNILLNLVAITLFLKTI